ncbi:phosphatase PAP2 family protein [Bacillus sp. 165]|uniref:phosphatase PAP2 family protein n=1 Tax=Bacillus sp. 165 TaxID=1529117 RepID=UPI001ADAFFB4|nr:phosphatase PAP2 family protein [Bacillus sp. 165]MBO9128485.1 phosphatase PAP2 family protein [Bacillus sp. 165]
MYKKLFNKHTYLGAFCMLLLFLFGIIVSKIMNKEPLVVDEVLKNQLQSFQSEGAITFFSYFTEMGAEAGIILVLILTLIWLWIKRRDYISMIILVVSVVGAQLLNKIIKEGVARERPSIQEAVDAIGYSFPSGHAMVGVVMYGFVAFLMIQGIAGKTKQAAVAVCAAVLVILIGLSRIVLSVHYPSDVLGGYCLGGLLLVSFLYLNYFLHVRFKK